ncbi:c-type cytochrome biogenesis protein CcsB [soil metagenome]
MSPLVADLLLYATAASYFAAFLVFLLHLSGNKSFRTAAPKAVGLVAVGAALHVAHIIVASLVLRVCPIMGIHFTMSVVSALACIVFLFVRFRYKVDVVGVIVAPVALTFLLASVAVGRGESADAGPMTSAILPLHVLANMLGEALFLLAFAAAVAYLVQERRLKQKRLTGLFQRLPPLDTLDRAEHGFLLAGFLPLTVGIVTGALWARKVEAGSIVDVWRAAFGYATWGLFAMVLLMRTVAGWRGRRAAYGTIAGFGFAVAVLLIYLFRTQGNVGPVAELVLEIAAR